MRMNITRGSIQCRGYAKTEIQNSRFYKKKTFVNWMTILTANSLVNISHGNSIFFTKVRTINFLLHVSFKELSMKKHYINIHEQQTLTKQ